MLNTCRRATLIATPAAVDALERVDEEAAQMLGDDAPTAVATVPPSRVVAVSAGERVSLTDERCGEFSVQ